MSKAPRFGDAVDDFNAIRRGSAPVAARLVHAGHDPANGKLAAVATGTEQAASFQPAGSCGVASRTILLYGDAETAQRLNAAAEQAGRFLVAGPSGWVFESAKARWWFEVFERQPICNRRTPLPGGSQSLSLVPHDRRQLAELRRWPLRERIPAAWLDRPPEAWLIDLDDAATACRDLAADLAEAATANDAPGPLTKNALKPPQLTGAAKDAADYIRDHPGALGKNIARAVGCGEEHFRRVFREKLRPLGFYNAGGTEGYYPPDT